MRKKVISVPKNECALDTLAILGEQTKNAWIFFHKNVVEELEKSADDIVRDEYRKLFWKRTETYPETVLYLEIGEVWSTVRHIIADDIAFNEIPADPDEIFFLKMKE